MQKFLIILITLVFAGQFSGRAQFNPQNRRQFRAIPASPNAAAAAKAAQFPVNLNTGTLSVSIPLSEVTERDYALPVSLEYQTGGIKVAQIGGWAGMGWNLNAGGIITREVRDLPDDYFGLESNAYRELDYINPNPYNLSPSFRYVDLYAYGWLTHACSKGHQGVGSQGGYNTAKYIYQDLQSKRPGYVVQDFENEVAPLFATLSLWDPANPIVKGLRMFEGVENLADNVANPAPLTHPKFEHTSFDSEPDIFYLKLPGKSVKFVFDGDGAPRQIPYQDVKIETMNSMAVPATPGTTGCNMAIDLTFKVTDTDGTVYMFDVVERSLSTTVVRFLDPDKFNTGIREYLMECSGCFLGNENQNLRGGQTNNNVKRNAASAWYLSRIISPTGAEITFTYTDEDYSYDLPLEKMRWALPASNRSADVEFTSGFHELSSGVITRNLIEVSGKRLSTIESSRTKLTFNALTQREDLDGTSYLLDNITCETKFNGINTQVQQFKLHYETKVSGLDIPFGSTVPVIGAAYRRHFLTRVTPFDAANQAKPAYRFAYNATPLPNRFSFRQDHWGYYAVNNTGNAAFNDPSLIPQLFVYPDIVAANDRIHIYPLTGQTTELILPGRDRKVDPQTIAAGSLTQVHYPGGGMATFEYEPNDFYDPRAAGNTTVQGGGLRIKRTNYNPELAYGANNTMVTEYFYNSPQSTLQSSGVLVQMPQYAWTTVYGRNPEKPTGPSYGATYSTFNGPPADSWLNCIDPLPSGMNSYTPFMKYNFFTLRRSASAAALSDIDGIQVAYTHVSVLRQGAGKTVYEFHKPKNYLENATTAYITRVDNSIQGNTHSHNHDPNELQYYYGGEGYYPGLLKPFWESGGMSVSTGYKNYFPFPPLTDDPGQLQIPYGHLLKKTEYSELNGSYAPVKETSYTYTLVGLYTNTPGANIVKGLRYGERATHNNALNITSPRSYGFYKYITDKVLAPYEETVSILDRQNPNDQTKTFESKITYLYEADAAAPWLIRPQPARIEQLNSDGSTAIRLFRYPYNFAGYSGPVPAPAGATERQVAAAALTEMKRANRIASPVETRNLLKKPGQSEKMLGASLITYKFGSALHNVPQPAGAGTVAQATVPASTKVFTPAQPVNPATGFTAPEIINNQLAFNDAQLGEEIRLELFDAKNNLLQKQRKDGFTSSILYDRKNGLPIARFTNARVNAEPVGDEAGFIGFENLPVAAESPQEYAAYQDYWISQSPASMPADAHTGNFSFPVDHGQAGTFYGPTRDFRPANQNHKFKFSAWIKTPAGYSGGGKLVIYSKEDNITTQPYPNVAEAYQSVAIPNTNGQWQYVEAVLDLEKLRAATNIPVTQPLYIRCLILNDDNSGFLADDLRFHPADAVVKSLTYYPATQKPSSVSDENGRPVYMEYDASGRRTLIKDAEGNIRKKIDYNFGE